MPHAGAILTREHLIHVLTEAAEIEHNLLCSYLYAAFSLKRSGEPGLSDVQSAATERWRKTIVTVALEEMAHLATVNNLLIAVDGAPHFDRPNLPLAPGYLPGAMVVRLAPFNAETLDHFIFLERSEHHELEDAPGYEPSDAERQLRRGALTPSVGDYETVGELYDSIAAGLAAIAERLGEATLLDVTGARQLDGATAGLPSVRRLTSLREALDAVAWIKEEGEGSSGSADGVESHFDRFCGIRDEWAELVSQDRAFEPAWPAASDPVMRKPAGDAVRVWVTAEPAAGVLDLGNAIYGLMLQVLNQTFSCEDAEAQRRLMKGSVELMEACAAVATELARLPASDAHPGVNAGLTFAAPRNLGFRPATENRWRDLSERVGELRRGSEPLVAKVGEVAREKVARRLAAAAELFEG